MTAAAGLPAEASADQIATAFATLKSKAAGAGTFDPTQYVPIALYQALASQAQTNQAGAVDDAIKAGKLTPAQRDWAIAYHSANPTGFAAFAKSAPVIVAPGAAGQSGGSGAASSDPALTDLEKVIAANCGLTPEEYKKYAGGR